MKQSNQFLIESWNHKAWGPHYHVIYGPFDLQFKREIIEELKRNLEVGARFISYVLD